VAYDLFCREGINAFSVEELVPAVLDLREKLWRVDWLEAEVERRAPPGKHTCSPSSISSTSGSVATTTRVPLHHTLLEVHDEMDVRWMRSVAGALLERETS
jgi:hypothetical protein